VEKESYGKLKFRKATAFKQKREENAWAEVFEVTDVEIHHLLFLLQERGWPMMEAGYELTSEAGIIIATAELGWPELKIALLQQTEFG
jgi:DEAD/DEAH box helicase domain-containing protein